MAHSAGESNGGALRLDFDRIMLQFCSSVVTSDAGLLPYRELVGVLGLTVIGNSLADARSCRRHPVAAQDLKVLCEANYFFSARLATPALLS
jgi:hypothetical protein